MKNENWLNRDNLLYKHKIKSCSFSRNSLILLGCLHCQEVYLISLKRLKPYACIVIASVDKVVTELYKWMGIQTKLEKG